MVSQPVRLEAEVVFDAQAQHLERGDAPARLREGGGGFGRDVQPATSCLIARVLRWYSGTRTS